MPVVRTDGRAYGHVITKFSRMGRLPHFLTHGALLRARAPLKLANTFNILFFLGLVKNAGRDLILKRMKRAR